MADIRFLRTGAGLVTALSLGLGLVVGGCSGSGDDDDDSTTTGSSPTPTATPEWEGVINFSNLAQNDTIALKQDGTYDVDFQVTNQSSNFKFAAPGSCNGSHQCLHVHVLLDGTAGGDPYNAAGYTSPITADFTKLSDPTGKHNIKLQVVYDDHTPVESAGGVTDVDVNVPAAPEVKPTIIIGTPINNATITLDASNKVSIISKVTGFTLMDSCGSTANCGHIQVKVSDADGNNACNMSGQDYNYSGVGTTDEKGNTTISADIGLCSSKSGQKMLAVQLVDDGGTAITGPTAKDSVTVNVLSSTDPAITVTSPANGDTVTLGSDGYMTVPVSFNVSNFTLAAPGDCGSVSNTCGHVHLTIDGENGNAAGGAPYNNAGADTTIDARFYWLLYNGFEPTGVHQLTLSLHADDHSAIAINGIPVETKVTLTTQASTNPSISIKTPLSGGTAILGTDAQQTVHVTYSVANFTLMPPGDCGGTPNCGHIHLLIDDAAGNCGASPYNNAGADPKTIDAYFQCVVDNGGTATGQHVISLELHDDSHAPVTASTDDGPFTIADFTHVNVQAAPSGGGSLK